MPCSSLEVKTNKRKGETACGASIFINLTNEQRICFHPEGDGWGIGKPSWVRVLSVASLMKCDLEVNY